MGRMVEENPLLVADIGGTNSRFAIADSRAGTVSLACVTRFANAGTENFKALLSRFLRELDRPPPRQACIAIAGPTDGNSGSLTNGRWTFDRADLSRDFGIADVTLVNDFMALASSVCSLQPEHLQSLRRGTAVVGAPLCVIGPGTGLGVACVVSPGPGQTVIATEGGHVDLAAITQQEWSLRQMLCQHTDAAICAEDVLSGEGLRRIDAFVRGATHSRRPVELITQEALQGDRTAGQQTVELFLTLLARFAGNAALSQGARGGVFIGGGILPRLLPAIDVARFTRDFSDKGAMTDYCEAIPISVITDADAALRGAAVAFYQAKTRPPCDENL